MGLVERMPRASSARVHRWMLAIEAGAWIAGFACLFYAGTRHVDATRDVREALQRFDALQAAQARARAPDLTLWSPQRIAAWQGTLDDPRDAPLAVLRIPRIHLDVPVLEGTSDRTLDRGAGHIEETAIPGSDGNVGIAGHRDGFFRGLKDVVAGDAIELDTLQGTQIYRIERTWIVTPDEVSVLDPTPEPSLTLVTCHPFYYVGAAPERFVVRAVRTGTLLLSSHDQR